MHFFCISLWIIPNDQFEKAITQGLWSLTVIISRGCFNLQLVNLHAEVLTLWKPSAMKIRKTQPPQMQAAYLGFSLHLPCTPPLHPFPFTRVYTGRGLDGCTLTSCMTKISRIHTGFCRETRGWISRGFVVHASFSLSSMTWLSLARLICQWIINSACIWNLQST